MGIMCAKSLEKLTLKIVLLLIGLFAFTCNISALSVPQITSFKEEVKEKNALRIEFSSNNSGNDYSYEIININTNKKNTLGGSSKYYVYQNLKEGIRYTVMLRVCSNKNDSYLCSKWVKKEASLGEKIVLNKPVIKTISTSSNGAFIEYLIEDTISGIEVLNNTTGNTFKTTNRYSYTYKNLTPGTYNFSVRSYYKSDKGIIYSDYSDQKSVTILDTNKGKDSISVKTSYKKRINSEPFDLNASSKSNKNIRYKSKDNKVAYVTKEGKVYLNGVGTTTIKVYTNDSSNYKGVSKNVKISVLKRTNKPTIGEAASGNNGFGDSNGLEVRTKKYYKNDSYANWNYVFRFKNPERAEKAADAMIDACNNNKIGYDNRSKAKSMSFTYELRKAGFEPSSINNKCATACSQLVLSMVQVSGLHRDEKDYPYKNAYSAAKKLSKDKNFRKYTSDDYTKSYKKLRRGDILVDTNGKRHMLMIVK